MLHIGIDMHKRFSEVAVLDDAGKVIARQTLHHDNRERMIDFFAKFGPDATATVEATRNWYWLYELLESQKLAVKLAHPLKVRVIAEAKVKNDKIDAWVLGHLERLGFLPEAYIPGREVRDQREALRYRISLVRARAMFKNRVHAILDKLGITHKFTDLFGRTGLEFLQTVELRPIYRQELDGYLAVIEFLEVKIAEATKLIRAILKPDPRVKLLMTIPGIGELTAYLLLCEIGDIKRFPTAKKLCGYAGITPIVRESADHRWQGRITKQGNRYIRWSIVEAAQVAPRQDSALLAFYDRLAERRGPKKARVAIGRKLLVAVWQVLTYEQEYRYNSLAKYCE
jgi:transposase